MTLRVFLGAICARCLTWNFYLPILTSTSSKEVASIFPALLLARNILKFSTVLLYGSSYLLRSISVTSPPICSLIFYFSFFFFSSLSYFFLLAIENFNDKMIEESSFGVIIVPFIIWEVDKSGMVLKRREDTLEQLRMDWESLIMIYCQNWTKFK